MILSCQPTLSASGLSISPICDHDSEPTNKQRYAQKNRVFLCPHSKSVQQVLCPCAIGYLSVCNRFVIITLCSGSSVGVLRVLCRCATCPLSLCNRFSFGVQQVCCRCATGSLLLHCVMGLLLECWGSSVGVLRVLHHCATGSLLVTRCATGFLSLCNRFTVSVEKGRKCLTQEWHILYCLIHNMSNR